MAKKLKLSQCMIVKDEEDNIEKALSWGKGLVCEQIVVDTGSTDHTVELAEHMGAKVYRFEWQDDFSAAKNYAIGQAVGDWIAFLDADEYFRTEDIPRLKSVLTAFDQNPAYKKIDLIRCTMLHLEDNGKAFSSMKQDRIFRNHRIRYCNKIHEALFHQSGRNLVCAELGETIPIMHTGYSKSALVKHGKGERNLSILCKELKLNPENYNLWAYYADSLLLEDRLDEAKEAYWEVVRHSDGEIKIELLLNSIANLIRYSIGDSLLSRADLEFIYSQYLKLGKKHPDVEYWTGLYMFQAHFWEEAVMHLEKAFEDIEEYSTSFTLYIMGCLDMAYNFLTDAYLELGNKTGAVKSITLSLKVNRYQKEEILRLLTLFGEAAESGGQVLLFLEKLYDIRCLKDKLFLLRGAKESGYSELEAALQVKFTSQERQWLEADSSTVSYISEEEILKVFPCATYRNKTDKEFYSLLYTLHFMAEDEILNQLKIVLSQWKLEHPELEGKLVKFYETHPFWGSFYPELEDYAAFINRIALLKKREDEFLWVYENLSDYRSKRTFLAILKSWYTLSSKELDRVKEGGTAYYDPDIMITDADEVLVDMEAGKGDYIKSYIEQFGTQYKQIYCCEERKALLPLLYQMAVQYPEMTIIEKLFPDVRLISDVSFMRLNAREHTEEILRGYEELIRKNHPKMTVFNFYSYKDIIEIPRLLKEYYPEYQLYMRYFGEDLIPTDYILYASPHEQEKYSK